MTWLRKASDFLMGCACIALGAAAFVVLLPFILVCLICLLTPPPFTLIVNLVFPVFYFMGPNGASRCLDGLMSGVRFLLGKAVDFFRAASA